MESDYEVAPTSWAPNQRELLIERLKADGKEDLAVFDLEDRKIRRFLSSDFNIKDGKFSPDGKWVAYQSDESGRDEICLVSYPAAKQKRVVSQAGGHAPRWSENGRVLYFLDPSDAVLRIRASSVGGHLALQTPERVFQPPILPPPYDSGSFDVSVREPRFLINTIASRNASEYVLITSWSR